MKQGIINRIEKLYISLIFFQIISKEIQLKTTIFRNHELHTLKLRTSAYRTYALSLLLIGPMYSLCMLILVTWYI